MFCPVIQRPSVLVCWDAVPNFMGPVLSRQECDLFAHACCRVTYGWDEAYPSAHSPLVTQGAIFTDSRAIFLGFRPLKKLCHGSNRGKWLSSTSQSPFVKDYSWHKLRKRSFSILQTEETSKQTWSVNEVLRSWPGPEWRCTSRLIRPCLYEVSRQRQAMCCPAKTQ